MEINLDSYEYYYNDEEKVLAKTPVDISKETTNKKISIEYYKNIFKKDFYLFRRQNTGNHVIFDSDSLHKIINKSDETSVPGFNLVLDFEILSVSRSEERRVGKDCSNKSRATYGKKSEWIDEY